tara:strand:- start:7368 stop:7982 length:615 start_codon:yes stop_codon:yes gene_type:complete
MADEKPAAKAQRRLRETLRKRWRAWLRAVHRDIGYLAVGLTFVYAISGIAINHLGDWDPNFKSVVETSELSGPYPDDEELLASKVIEHLEINADEVQASYFDTDTVFEVSLADSTAQLDMESGMVKVASKKPRFMLRVVNWLHYNRGKSAWTYIADGYAILLLYLAISGAFMLKGRKGFIGRGAILITIGAAVPIAYVQLASGP